MSRALTSAQVIEKGDYLKPDFDPATLTVAQLLGVFGFHNINYPSPYTKGKLVQIFSDEITNKTAKLSKERLHRQNSQASDDGITDGVTGKPINEGRKAPVTRGASRRASRAPSEVVDPAPVKPEPVKRRRSSAEPSLGGPSRRRAAKPMEPVVVEDSEPDEPVVRKVSRNKKNATEAGARARRVSQTVAEEVDSGWEDNNVFQSGAESSPARPSPVRPRTRRPTAIPRASKAMSVPPQFAPPSPTKEEPTKIPRRRAPSVKPPESEFEPVLPPEAMRETKATSSKPKRGQLVAEVVIESEVAQPSARVKDEEVYLERQAEEDRPTDIGTEWREQSVAEDLQYPDEEKSPASDLEELPEAVSDIAEDEQTVAISQRISEGGKLIRHTEEASASTPLILRLLLILLAMGSLHTLYDYKTESALIGFCETGTKTNNVLEGLRSRRALVEACNRENRTLLYAPTETDSTDSVHSPLPIQTAVPDGEVAEGTEIVLAESCPPLPLLPIPRPDSCIQCPAHATCTSSTMVCETGYLLRPHPLLSFLSLPHTSTPKNPNAVNTYVLPTHDAGPSETGISQLVHTALALVLDGVPGLGSVALPPRCVEDPRRKRHIGALGKAVESMLAAERGRRLCAGVGQSEQPGTEAQEAQKWGVEVDDLRESLRRKTSPQLMPAFEDTFNEAIQQLVAWGGVFVGENPEGKRYLAHHTPAMDWTCVIKVKARESWVEWRTQIFALLSIIMGTITVRRRRARNLIENDRAGSLVQIALDLLRNQELAHHTDPITAPQPYLSSLQLRDLILQDEHSIRARSRLWERVERVVESNSNVRTNLEEVEGGDEMRVWRWVGSSAGTVLSPGRTPARAYPYKTEQPDELAT